MRLGIAVLLFASASSAQGTLPTQVIFVGNPGSQVNTIQAGLELTAFWQIAGVPQGPPVLVTPTWFPGVTAIWQIGQLPSVNVELVVTGNVRGTVSLPFTLAAAVVPGTFPCCTLQGWLPSSIQAQGIGLYHLGAAPLSVLDGLGLFGAPSGLAVTNPNGLFPVNANVPINSPDHVAVQAIVTDVTSPTGLTLTAAISVAKYQ